MNITQIIEECAEITRSKGFDTTQHATQVALIATEVGEALECISVSGVTPVTAAFVNNIQSLSEDFEMHRKATTQHVDGSTVADQDHLNEELADIVIRVFSYVGGNGQAQPFVSALSDKMAANRKRPERHGKAF